METKLQSPYILEITNTSLTEEVYTLFGSNENILKDNFGNGINIKITNICTKLAYDSLLREIEDYPFTLQFLRMQSSNLAQFKKLLNYKRIDDQGKPIEHEICFTPDEIQEDCSDIKFQEDQKYSLIDGNTCLSGIILPSTTITFSIFPSKQVPSKKLLIKKYQNLKISVQNNSLEEKNISLFGRHKNLGLSNFGNSAEISLSAFQLHGAPITYMYALNLNYFVETIATNIPDDQYITFKTMKNNGTEVHVPKRITNGKIEFFRTNEINGSDEISFKIQPKSTVFLLLNPTKI